MKPRRAACVRVIALTLAAVLACAEGLALGAREDTEAERYPADLVLRGGRIYTVDRQRRSVEALAVRGGRIVALGSAVEIAPLVGAETRLVELGDEMVLPGFHDAHVHPLQGGIDALGCDLAGLASVHAVLARVRECAARDGGTGWVVASGWDLSLFPAANPSRHLLDRSVPDRPVFLQGADGHSAWVNSRALALAGLTRETPAPPRGVIEREPETGEPSGTLRESAIALVRELVPPPDEERRREGLRLGLRQAASAGITSLLDAAVGRADLEVYGELDEHGELRARVTACAVLAPGGASELDALLAERERFRSARLDPDCVKIFVDGVLEGETAALIDPYLDGGAPSGRRGTLLHEPAALAEVVARLDRTGLHVHLHAIGDRAVRTALDAIEHARERNGPGGRHHIAHLQLIAPDDLARFRTLGVTANVQALWAYPDAYITDVNLPAVGRERVDRMYPIGSLRRAGARIVGGSDWPVSSIRPLDAIEVALTRQDPRGERPGELNRAERVDLATMIAAYTIEGAWLVGREGETGSLEVGKLADLVILERDLFDLLPAEISEVRVLRTFLEGEAIFED
jgi:hypothetical protein